MVLSPPMTPLMLLCSSCSSIFLLYLFFSLSDPPPQLLQHILQLPFISWAKTLLFLEKEAFMFGVNRGLLLEKHSTVLMGSPHRHGYSLFTLCETVLFTSITKYFPHRCIKTVLQSLLSFEWQLAARVQEVCTHAGGAAGCDQVVPEEEKVMSPPPMRGWIMISGFGEEQFSPLLCNEVEVCNNGLLLFWGQNYVKCKFGVWIILFLFPLLKKIRKNAKMQHFCKKRCWDSSGSTPFPPKI